MDKIAPDLMEVLLRRERDYARALEQNDRAAIELGDAPIDVRVAFDGPANSLIAAGFPIGGFISEVAQGGLSPAQIRNLANLAHVHSIGFPAKSRVKLNKSVPEILAKDAWAVPVPAGGDARGKGEGVIIGIIDTGIDVFHGAFRDAAGKSRILRLWDQTFDYGPGANGLPTDNHGIVITGDLVPKDETGAVLKRARAPLDMRIPADDPVPGGDPGRPNLFTNGAQFNTQQINAALAAHPNGKDLPISLLDDAVAQNGHEVQHGTHVAGIAAGNGAQNDKCTSPFTYVGVAPQANIVIVKAGIGGTPNRIENMVEAIEYIFRVAAKEVPPKPCVINISSDTHFGPHNGQSDESRAIEGFISGGAAKGRAIVMSAGNERHLDMHAAFTIPKGTSQEVRINLKTKKQKQFAFFGSYNGNATVTCVARAPDPPPVQQTVVLRTDVLNQDRRPVGTLTHKVLGSLFTASTSDPDSHLFVLASDDNALTTGVWTFVFTAAAARADANIHLWITDPPEDGAAFVPFPGTVASAQDAGRKDPKLRRPEAWIGATIGRKASTRNAITVASYDAEANPTALEHSSSQGPAPNSLALGLYDRSAIGAYDKPDIAAPGVAIDAPRGGARKCCLECECCVDRYVAETGTSMAAPHITGVVALMFARNPLLTTDEIKARFKTTSRVPPAAAPPLPPPPAGPEVKDQWGFGKVNAKAAVLASVISEMAPEADTAREPVPAETGILPVGWPERLHAWGDILGRHPAWNLCAALVSQHFDEVKRLIDTNRRVAAVWQRHGGPALVRGIAFANVPPDPPIPAELETGQPIDLMTRILRVLLRFGGEKLRADIARYAPLMQALPGASWNELDELIAGGHR